MRVKALSGFYARTDLFPAVLLGVKLQDPPRAMLHAAFSICRTRSSHKMISPIRLFVRFTCPLAALRLRAVERSIATRPSLEIRSHLVVNLFASLASSAADFLSRASSLRMLSLERIGLGIESSIETNFKKPLPSVGCART